MEPARAVLHIEAIARFLEAAKSTSSADVLNNAREQQFSNVKRIIMECCLEGFDTAGLVKQIGDMGFSPDQHSELMQEVQHAIGRQSPCALPARVKLQDYTSIGSYFTQSAWDFLLCPNSTHVAKMHTIIFQSCLLGLRNPSEATFQHMTAIYMLCTDGLSKSLSQPPHARHETYMTLKTAFRQRASTAKRMYCILELPPTAEKFMEGHRALYNEVFQVEGPVKGRLNAEDLSMMQRNIPMRASRICLPSQNGFAGHVTLPGNPMHLMSQLQAMSQLALQTTSSNGIKLNLMTPAASGTFPAVPAPCLPLLDANHARVEVGDAPLMEDLSETKEKDSDALQLVLKAPSPASIPGNSPSQSSQKRSVSDATSIIQSAMLEKAAEAKAKAAKEEKAAKAASKKKTAKAKPVRKVPKSASQSVGHKKAAKPAAKAAVKGKTEKGVVKSKGHMQPVKKQSGKGAAAKSKAQTALPMYSKKAALKLRPNGCGKCRHTPGCAPSCVRNLFKFP